jgi:hypothetical protein
MKKLGLAFAAAVAVCAVSVLLASQTAQSKTLREGFIEELQKIGAPAAPAKAAPAKPAPAKPAAKKEEPMKAAPAKAEPAKK